MGCNMDGGVVLDLRDISKIFGQTVALKKVNLRITSGEFVGLLGSNGAGKSSLINIISGLSRPSGGKCYIFGKVYEQDAKEIRSKIGTVFQTSALDFEMTIEEILNFYAKIFGQNTRQRENSINSVCEMLDLSEVIMKPCKQLSGGQRRRVEIARVLINNPTFLIFDEATSGLDLKSRRDLLKEISYFTRKKLKTVIWATHIVEEVEKADRIMIINEGRIIADLPPEELCSITSRSNVGSAYEKIINDIILSNE